MSKVFKNARNASLRSNNFGQYLKYALGEIVLVVIGILLALAINNWNNDRKQAKKVENIFVVIKDDLVNDTTEVGQILAFYESQEDNFKAFRDGTATLEMFDTCRTCPFLTTVLLPTTIEQRGFDLLQRNTSEMSQDTLVNEISIIYNYSLKSLKIKQDMLQATVTENLNHWRQSYDWFAELMGGTLNEPFKKYTIEDPEYKNKMAWFYVLIYNNLVPELKLFQANMKKVLEGIEERI